MKKSLKYGIATAIVISAAIGGYAIYDTYYSRPVELMYGAPPIKDRINEDVMDSVVGNLYRDENIKYI